MIDHITIKIQTPEGIDPAGDDMRPLAWDAARRLVAQDGGAIVGPLEFGEVDDSGAAIWRFPAHRPEARI